MLFPISLCLVSSHSYNYSSHFLFLFSHFLVLFSFLISHFSFLISRFSFLVFISRFLFLFFLFLISYFLFLSCFLCLDSYSLFLSSFLISLFHFLFLISYPSHFSFPIAYRYNQWTTTIRSDVENQNWCFDLRDEPDLDASPTIQGTSIRAQNSLQITMSSGMTEDVTWSVEQGNECE